MKHIAYSSELLSHNKSKCIPLNPILIILSILVTLSSCATSKSLYGETHIQHTKIVNVHYATNRNILSKTNGITQFGTNNGEAVSYGLAEVNIPPHHGMGEIEKRNILRGEFYYDTLKHLFITRIIEMNKDTFFQSVNDSATNKNSALLYVHGYNNSFNDAIDRTAQIASDINFKGLAMAFSWPSQNSLISYPADENNIEIATPLIEKYIENILDSNNNLVLYIVAHSMGNRGITQAIIRLGNRKPDLLSRIQELILAAPDIDASLFKTDIAPKLITSLRRVTLYASSKDRALKASTFFHSINGRSMPRAGSGGEDIVVVSGMETIDASDIDTNWLGHGYVSEERLILVDLHDLINNNQSASKRPGLRFYRPKYFWMFKK